MTDQEFEQLVLSRVRPEFKPLAAYEPDNDSLEILISNESYRIEGKGHVCVYVGRESGEITGAIIKGFKRRYMHNPSHIRFETRDGSVKTVHLLKLMREWSPKEHATPVVFRLLIQKLEQIAEENNLETNIENLVTC